MTALAQHHAVVTGAGSGIGRAIALALAGHGASVWLVGRTLPKLQDAAGQARELGAEVFCCPHDLSRDGEAEALAERLRKEAGFVDVLVHSAGVIAMGPLESAPVEDLDRQFLVNLRAPYVLTQALLPMLKARRGQIVFVNSTAGMAASPNLSQYAATKFALRALADSLRAEVNAAGVRVLSVYPGRTATPMQEAVHRMEGRPYHPENLAQPEDVAALVLSALCLPRTAEVPDLFVRPMRKP